MDIPENAVGVGDAALDCERFMIVVGVGGVEGQRLLVAQDNGDSMLNPRVCYQLVPPEHVLGTFHRQCSPNRTVNDHLHLTDDMGTKSLAH